MGPLEAVPDPEPEPVRDTEPIRRHPHPLDLRPVRGEPYPRRNPEPASPLGLEPDEPSPLAPEPDEPWNPRIHRTVERDEDPWDSLPPSGRLRGTPADPGLRMRAPGPGRRRWAGVAAAVLAGVALVAGASAVVLRITAPPVESGRLSDSLARVTVTLPQGWRQGAVAPVTGFTSVIRDGGGGLVMARPVPGPVEDAEKATTEAAELYSRLLLKGDRVTVVENKELPGGRTRALRAEYQDVVNRPAFMRVTLLTRSGDGVLLVGLLQPEDTARRQALDSVMARIR
ncbi:hypothetical protein [Nonomuraea sp. NPDC049695]|uniref:hypothetical protein n=1 Tax=Nonomuraea sp. NPDC049695 TaxID=3154734 RepID=UPI00341F7E33